jgi:hypothetical protein
MVDFPIFIRASPFEHFFYNESMFCVPTGHGMRELRPGSADGLAAKVGLGRPLGPGSLPDCGSGDH